MVWKKQEKVKLVNNEDREERVNLKILPMVFRKNLHANMVVDFAVRTPVFVTEKFAGGVKGCMGDEETGY